MHVGTIQKWQDDKGFGFIDTDEGQSVFFHISEYRPPRKPITGEKVVFKLGEDQQGRTQAQQVQSAEFAQKQQAEYQQRQQKRDERQARQQAFALMQKSYLIIAAIFYIALAALVVVQLLPWVFLAWYVVFGVITFVLYAMDKQAAKSGEWRTKESTLHTLALLGGWVGAMIAHAYLRHKSKKAEFRAMYYATVVINLALLGGYLYF